jgi:hypothetical protein
VGSDELNTTVDTKGCEVPFTSVSWGGVARQTQSSRLRGSTGPLERAAGDRRILPGLRCTQSSFMLLQRYRSVCVAKG